MDFWGTVLVVFRRWYVVLPVLAASLGGAVQVYATVPLTYISNGVIVLSIPRTGGTLPTSPKLANPVTNPLLNFDYGLNMTASILIQALGAPAVAEELGVRPGDRTAFKVTNGSTNPELMLSGPFVFVEGESDTQQGAKDIVTKVLARAKVELVNRQIKVGAPRQTFLTAIEVVSPTTPEVKHGSKARAAAAALGIGLLLSLWSAFGVESFMAARKAKRGPGAVEEPVSGVRAAQPSGVR